MQKYDIVNALGRAYGGRRYLEICTPTTGARYSFIDPAVFTTRHRLMYRCPEAFDDGADFTFRTSAEGSCDIVRTIHALQSQVDRYDVIFVDPWHSYDASIADLYGALCLLQPGGVVVVHDCNPVDSAIATTAYQEGAWFGLTYQAFIDFALAADGARYCVVDADCGCGVLFTGAGAPFVAGKRPPDRLVFEWVLARDADATRFAFFERHRAALVNLVSPPDFSVSLQQVTLPLRLDYQPTPAPEPDPCLDLSINGVKMPLISYVDGWHRFAVPDHATHAAVVSPTFVASAQDGEPADTRILGVAVTALRAGHNGHLRSIGLADPCLTDGWYPDEAATGYPWRWTNGAARLALSPETTVLEIATERIGPGIDRAMPRRTPGDAECADQPPELRIVSGGQSSIG